MLLVCVMDAKNIKEVTQTSSGTKTRPRPSSIFNAGSLHDPLPLLSLHQRSKTGATTAEKMTTMRVFLQLTKDQSKFKFKSSEVCKFKSSEVCVCVIYNVYMNMHGQCEAWFCICILDIIQMKVDWMFRGM